MPDDSSANDPTTATILAFLRDIGIEVRLGDLSAPTFLPGIQIDQGALVVDPVRLRYPGDLLHEAGHLAVTSPERRATLHGNLGLDAGEEMMAIAWSYAALVQLQLDPAVVFHPDGYRGSSAAIIENFTHGRYFGVPLLQWVGMTLEPGPARAQGVQPYPHMLHWLRQS